MNVKDGRGNKQLQFVFKYQHVGRAGRFFDRDLQDQGEHQVQGEPHSLGRTRSSGYRHRRNERSSLGNHS
jgi:hypothetical protein